MAGGGGGEDTLGEEKKGIAARCHQLFKAGDYEGCLSGRFPNRAPRECFALDDALAGGGVGIDSTCRFSLPSSNAKNSRGCSDQEGMT